MGITSKTKPLSTAAFIAALKTHSPPPHETAYVVAYSGGVDSHVLLHLCVNAGLAVRAVHVHHGLQAQADDWAAHCQRVCDALGVALTQAHVDARPAPGESPEAAARNARYAALDDALQTGETLLLAQHKNDQAETVLLQLLRGAGAAGLSAMPWRGSTRRGRNILRPLLDFHRRQIEDYARQHRLQWVDDPSNRETRYRRNALRGQVIPAIEAHFPRVVDTLSRVAGQQQQNRQLLDDLARIDLAACAALQPGQLHLPPLRKLPAHRQFNLLRYWLHRHHSRPNRKCIEQIMGSLIHAGEDAQPVVRWQHFEMRRHAGRLYLLTPGETSAMTGRFEWQPAETLVIPELAMQLELAQQVPAGLDNRLLQQRLQLRFRHGGESLRPQGSEHHRSLKKLLQQAQVPPWQRRRIPLLYHGDALLAVVGYWLSAEHCVAQDETGWAPLLVETTNNGVSG